MPFSHGSRLWRGEDAFHDGLVAYFTRETPQPLLALGHVKHSAGLPVQRRWASGPLGKVVEYRVHHFDDLTRFVDDAEIPIDNNRSEQAFQDHARLRLNSLFAGSAEGGHRWAVLLGVVTTAQRLDLDVQAYLTWMFERRGTRNKEFGLRAS